MKELSSSKVLLSFIDNTEFECSWWCMFKELGENNSTDEKNILFPNISKIFNMSKEAMILFLLELRFMKKHGGILRINLKACESFKEILTDHQLFEVSSTRMQGKVKYYAKLASNCFLFYVQLKHCIRSKNKIEK